MYDIDTTNSTVEFRIVLEYKGKEYNCLGYGFYDESLDIWVSPYEFEGVRTCEHDYAALLPTEVIGNKDFGCDKKEIEVVDYDFYDTKTGRKL